MSKIIPETNRIYQDGSEIKFVAYDRIYQNLHKSLTLIQKNGTTYIGRIEKKSIKLEDGTLGHLYIRQQTIDGLIEQVCQLLNLLI